MKYYNHRAHKAHQYDLKVQKDTHLNRMLPHVLQIASQFSRESIAIGALNYQDLYQAGYLGLLEAWEKVDWDMINKSPNPDGQLWSYLKRRIKGAIRRSIDNGGDFIKVPRRELEEHRSKLTGVDKMLVNTFPKFFDEELPVWDNHSSYISIQLEEIIEDELYKVERNADNRHILLAFYGIGVDKTSQKKLAELYDTSHGNIQKIIARTRKKLNTKEFETIIENFYNK